MTDEERDELISAALDGERVDPQLLGAALASPSGAATTAEFVLLRAAVNADRDVAPRVAGLVVEKRRDLRHGWRLMPALRVPAGIAASLILAAAAVAFWAGTSWRQPVPEQGGIGAEVSVAPAPVRATQDGGRALPSRAGDATAPPTPARVLRFTPGVDWHEAS
jgi:hypothetical protein